MTSGERIRERRIELDLSQQQLAEMIGYKSKSSVNKLEWERRVPTKMIEKLAKALQCSPEYLMGWDHETRKLPKPRVTMVKLSRKERELVAGYRAATADRREDMLLIARGALKKRKGEKDNGNT